MVDVTTTATITTDVPTMFYDDHLNRGLEGGTIVKRLARTTRVELDEAAFGELLGDAWAYEDPRDFAEDFRGLCMSAKATARRLLAVATPWPTPEHPEARERRLRMDPAHQAKVRALEERLRQERVDAAAARQAIIDAGSPLVVTMPGGVWWNHHVTPGRLLANLGLVQDAASIVAVQGKTNGTTVDVLVYGIPVDVERAALDAIDEAVERVCRR